MVAGSHGYTADEIAATITEAETQISGIEQANKQITNRLFNQRIRIICDQARSIVDMLEDDPGDIRRARKFLNIYLDGALKVTTGYADMQRKRPKAIETKNELPAPIKAIPAVVSATIKAARFFCGHFGTKVIFLSRYSNSAEMPLRNRLAANK
jgi:5-bromo-4-chloroindolyl phosphate hydrolysis protein